MVKKRIILCSESLRDLPARIRSNTGEKFSYDSQAIIDLLKNNIPEIEEENVKIEPIGFGGKENFRKQVPRFTRDKFAEYRHRTDEKIYIVALMDSDTNDGNKIGGKKRQISNRVKELISQEEFTRFKMAFSVQAIEAWVLADEKSLNSILGTRGKVKHVNSPEEIEMPKEVLKGHFQKASKRYTPQVLREILPTLQVAELLRCKHFREFYEHVCHIVGSKENQPCQDIKSPCF